MTVHSPLILASFDYTRVPLMMLLGVALVIFTWRMLSHGEGRGRHLMMIGALLLGTGYAILFPLQDSGLLTPAQSGLAKAVDAHCGIIDTAMLDTAKMVVMNLGWLLFGGGLALRVSANRTPLATQIPQPE